jgi:hypothetical protein
VDFIARGNIIHRVRVFMPQTLKQTAFLTTDYTEHTENTRKYFCPRKTLIFTKENHNAADFIANGNIIHRKRVFSVVPSI